MQKTKRMTALLLAAIVAVLCIPHFDTGAAKVSAAANGVTMHRVYNPGTHEHLHTKDTNEVRVLTSYGWQYEGTSWTAPASSKTPVYRLFNQQTGEHFYTKDPVERRALLAARGIWNDENIGWYSDDAKGVPVYRLFNAAAGIGAHHYTTDAFERSVLMKNGWQDEGIAWYGMKVNASAPQQNATTTPTQPSQNTTPTPAQPTQPVHQHTWVTQNATCEKAGSVSCSNCGQLKETIPAKGHAWVEIGREPEMQSEVHHFCDACGMDFTANGVSGTDVSLHMQDHVLNKTGSINPGSSRRYDKVVYVPTGKDVVMYRCSTCGEEKGEIE